MRQRCFAAANGLSLRVRGPQRLKKVGDHDRLKVTVMAISTKLKEVVVQVDCESGLCIDAANGPVTGSSNPIPLIPKANERVVETINFELYRVSSSRREEHARAGVGCDVTDNSNYTCPRGPMVVVPVRIT